MGQNNGNTTAPLSTGGKIGVALAAALTSLLGGAALIFFWLRWRRRGGKGMPAAGWLWTGLGSEWWKGRHSSHLYGTPGVGSREDLNGKAEAINAETREMAEDGFEDSGGVPMTRTYLETIPEAASYLTRSAIEPDREEMDEEDEEDMGQARLISQDLEDDLGQWRVYEHG
jgi:hypothetical protein